MKFSRSALLTTQKLDKLMAAALPVIGTSLYSVSSPTLARRISRASAEVTLPSLSASQA